MLIREALSSHFSMPARGPRTNATVVDVRRPQLLCVCDAPLAKEGRLRLCIGYLNIEMSQPFREMFSSRISLPCGHFQRRTAQHGMVSK